MQIPTQPAARPASLKGVLWFGVSGAMLILIGLVAMLAANWHWVPFPAQIAVAFAPLVVAWGWCLRLWRQGWDDVAAEEVLGAIWAGGVICAVALLGRILQLASDEFAFCAVVTALLLPIVWLLRSKAAWFVCVGFAIAAACLVEEIGGLTRAQEAAGMLAVVAVCTVALTPRTVAQWRVGGADGVAWRWLIALGTSVWLIVASVALVGFLDCCMGWSETVVTALLVLFLAAFGFFAVSVERGRAPHDRPLSLFLTFGVFVLMFGFAAFGADIGLSGPAFPLWAVGAVTLLACVAPVCRGRLRDEGVFLFLAPAVCATLATESGWVSLAGTLAVGIAALAHGVVVGRRMVANEGLILTLGATWSGAVAAEANLMLRGGVLVVGGVALLALNLLIARRARKEAHHE